MNWIPPQIKANLKEEQPYVEEDEFKPLSKLKLYCTGGQKVKYPLEGSSFFVQHDESNFLKWDHESHKDDIMKALKDSKLNLEANGGGPGCMGDSGWCIYGFRSHYVGLKSRSQIDSKGPKNSSLTKTWTIPILLRFFARFDCHLNNKHKHIYYLSLNWQ